MDETRKGITRLSFLKQSSSLAAGFIFLPRPADTAPTESHRVRQVPLEELIGYQIVLPDKANPHEKQAAQKLQYYLGELGHKQMALTPEHEYKGKAAFFIGQTRFAELKGVNLKQLNEDGFVLFPAGKNLIVAGGSGKGVLYGVYGFLELCGFRMYEAAAIQVPRLTSIGVPKDEVVVNPVVHYRTTSYRDTRDPEYTNWHGLSSRDLWGLFVHTFNELVPPDQYGKSHPEYFSLVNGIRLPGTQLCLSNHDVLETLTANLRTKIAAKPEATYWSVSQNDNDQYCRCDACTKLNTTYGGVPSGSILYFVNQVATAFPDKTISTLAYWYSRSAPQNIKPKRNVNIMLCNIESRRQAPVFQTDPAFSRDLEAWGRLSDNILIWDYNIQFTNLVSPFPNLHTIKPNVKFFTGHHVNSLYMQANGQARGEFSALRAYLICELMWNPDADDNAIINEFLSGYYGGAAPYIRQYIDKMREALLRSGLKLNIFGSPEDAKDGYLSSEMITLYKRLFDDAEKAVEQDPQLRKRVKVARLPVTYAEIQIGRNEVDTPRSLFAHTGDGHVIAKPEMKTLIDQFVNLCEEDGVTRLRERSITPADYRASYNRIFTKMAEMTHAKSFQRKIIPGTLPEGGDAALYRLTDGIFGSFESWRAPDVNWVSYKGKHTDFTLDLGEVCEIQSITMDFLNAQAQPDWNLLVLPQFVTYAISIDGTAFSNELKVANPNNPNPKENPDIAKVQFQSFRADLGSPVKARYIRAHAESMLRMPSWHIRAGHPASIETDQIVVI